MMMPLLQKGKAEFTSERRLWIACIGFAGIIGFGLGNGHTTENSIHHISAQLGQVKAEAGCEHSRAEKAEALAVKPVMVDPSQLPKDCPHSK